MTRFRRTLVVAAALSGLLVCVLVGLGLFGVAVPAGPLRRVAEARVSAALGRPVEIGALGFVPRLPPVVEARAIVVGPAHSREPDLLRVSRLRLQVELLALGRGELRIREIEGSGIRLALTDELSDQGSPDHGHHPPDTQSAGEPGVLPRLALGHLVLRDVGLRYVPDEGGDPFELWADTLEAWAPLGESLRLTLQGSLGETSLGLQLEGGSLSDLVDEAASWRFQARAHWGDLAVEGDGSRDRSRGSRCIRAELRSESLDVGALARQFRVPGSASGRVEGLRVVLAAPCSGGLDPLGELDLELRVEAADAHLSDPEGKEISLEVERLTLAHTANEGLRASAQLTLAEEPLAIEVQAGNLAALGREAWPVRGTLEGAGSRLEGSGTLGPEAGAFRLELRASGERIGDLAGWLGFPGDADAPYRAQGQLEHGSDGWRLDLKQVELGRSRARVALAFGNPAGGTPLTAVVAAEMLDLPELSTVLLGGPVELQPGDQPLAVDVPIIPGRLALEDADLELSVARFDESWGEVSDLFVAARIREGKLRGPVRATIGGVGLRGEARIDPTLDVPRAALDLTAEDADLGDFLRRLDLVAGLEARAGWLRARWQGRGRSLAELGRTSRLEAEFRRATWTIGNAGSQVRVQFDQGSLSAAPDVGTRLDFEGALDELPVEVRLETAPLVDVVRSHEPLKFELRARIPDAEIRISGRAAVPFDGEGEVFFESWGPRLDALGPLLDVELPSIGPHRTQGRLEVHGNVYRLSDARIQIGETELEGRAELDVGLEPPRLDAWLHALHLQLDDFDPGEDRQAGEATPAGAGSEPASLLDPVTLARLDAIVDVEVDRVSLGADRLGDGTLRVVVEDGRLVVDPIEVRLGAGNATLSANCEPAKGQLLCDIRTRVPRLDYGLVARQYDPATDTKGLLTLDSALSSVSTDPDVLFEGASGRFDLVAWPEQMRAGVIDFFSVNLLFAVLPLLGIAESSVNCVVARFDVENGVMRHETLLIDTTQVRVQGRGTIDLKRRRIDLVLQPQAKRVRMFGMETPLVVRGYFSDFRAGVSPASLMNTVFNFTTSVVTAPWNWIFGSPPPADGSDVCTDPLVR